MNELRSEGSLRVLVAEDDYGLSNEHVACFSKYANALELRVAHDAGAVLSVLEKWRPRLLVLDLMMPYGDAAGLLKSAGDSSMVDTGLRLLDWIRQDEKQKGLSPIWVAVTTARSDMRALRKVEALLGGHGSIFQKPFDSICFEVAICDVLRLPVELDASLVNDARNELKRQGARP